MNGLLGKASCAAYPPAMRAPFVYRVTAVCVFLMGFALHLTNVVIGPDRLVAKVFSPRVEIVFAVMMIVAAISGWMSLKRLSSRGLLRVVYWFALILITLSIPIHVRSVVIWSTAWVHAFPKYYSHVETPMFLALAYAVTRFRFRGEGSTCELSQRRRSASLGHSGTKTALRCLHPARSKCYLCPRFVLLPMFPVAQKS